MAKLKNLPKALKEKDERNTLFTENAIIEINGEYDIYLRGFEKIGRREIARLERANNNGVMVGDFVYLSDLFKSVKSGSAKVIAK